MSCGDPHGTGDLGHRPGAEDSDCAKALERMFHFIDHELAEADASDIQQHLDDCGPCLDKYDLERTVKALVARSCSEHAPETLRQRVLVSIREVHVRIVE